VSDVDTSDSRALPLARPHAPPSSADREAAAERPADGTELPARRERVLPWRLGSFVATVAGVILLDQWTKQLARQYLVENGLPRTIPMVGDLFKLTYVENRGAAFGLLQNQTVFFVVVGVVVIGVIIVSYRQMAAPSMFLNLCLGLQMGGAIGNLIDRVKDGYVVDFLELPYWPVFNIADSAIVVGVAGLAFKVLFPDRGSREHESA
jgi:signal peptidase II